MYKLSDHYTYCRTLTDLCPLFETQVSFRLSGLIFRPERTLYKIQYNDSLGELPSYILSAKHDDEDDLHNKWNKLSEFSRAANLKE